MIHERNPFIKRINDYKKISDKSISSLRILCNSLKNIGSIDSYIEEYKRVNARYKTFKKPSPNFYIDNKMKKHYINLSDAVKKINNHELTEILNSENKKIIEELLSSLKDIEKTAKESNENYIKKRIDGKQKTL